MFVRREDDDGRVRRGRTDERVDRVFVVFHFLNGLDRVALVSEQSLNGRRERFFINILIYIIYT